MDFYCANSRLARRPGSLYASGVMVRLFPNFLSVLVMLSLSATAVLAQKPASEVPA